MTRTVSISGMSCQHCVNRVKASLSEVAGVKSVDVDLKAGKASVEGDGLDDAALRAAVDDAGYDVTGVE